MPGGHADMPSTVNLETKENTKLCELHRVPQSKFLLLLSLSSIENWTGSKSGLQQNKSSNLRAIRSQTFRHIRSRHFVKLRACLIEWNFHGAIGNVSQITMCSCGKKMKN